jgi:transcription elongation factor GreA
MSNVTESAEELLLSRVSRGSHVVLEDLDDATRADYVLVASADSDPEQGRLSDESPVGRAISGHRQGDVVVAHAPHRVRHLRIAEVDRRNSEARSRQPCSETDPY